MKYIKKLVKQGHYFCSKTIQNKSKRVLRYWEQMHFQKSCEKFLVRISFLLVDQGIATIVLGYVNIRCLCFAKHLRQIPKKTQVTPRVLEACFLWQIVETIHFQQTTPKNYEQLTPYMDVLRHKAGFILNTKYNSKYNVQDAFYAL